MNHDKGRALSYGDALLGGTHASISILVANPAARGLEDLTKGDPAWADAKDVFEHEHPAIYAHNEFLTGEAWALAFDPTTNVPWYANQFRMASLPGYASMQRPQLSSHFHGPWWGNQDPPNPHLWIWSEDADPADPTKRDGVQSIAFCDDGTMWVGSDAHGLAFRRKGASTFTTVGVPSDAGGALAVACDPLDGSVWVGFAWGGFGRYRSGAWVKDIASDDAAGVRARAGPVDPDRPLGEPADRLHGAPRVEPRAGRGDRLRRAVKRRPDGAHDDATPRRLPPRREGRGVTDSASARVVALHHLARPRLARRAARARPSGSTSGAPRRRGARASVRR